MNRMKKTCNGCRAYEKEIDTGEIAGYCSLGYKTDYKKIPFYKGFIKILIPAEKCFKPKTWDEYFIIKEEIRKCGK